MSSIRISEDGNMRQHYADSHDAGQIHDSTRRTSNRKPTAPARYFASWTEDGEPMSTKLGRNDSTLPSDMTRPNRHSPLAQCYSAWTEDGKPVVKKTEEHDSIPLRSNGGRSELPRRGRPPPWKVKITTAEVDENGKLERDVSMRWFPSGTGTEMKPSKAYVEMAIDFALKQERLIPWCTASQQSGTNIEVKRFHKATDDHLGVTVIERPKDQEEGTIGYENWIKVGV